MYDWKSLILMLDRSEITFRENREIHEFELIWTLDERIWTFDGA